MAYITIHGDVDISRISVLNQNVSKENIPDILAKIKGYGLSDSKWESNSVMLANMNDTLSGNGADYQFKNIKRFKVYKHIGNNNDKLYHVYETNSGNERTVDDYTIGDMCDTQYFVYPVCTKEINGVSVEVISQPLVSEKISTNKGILSVIGLIRKDENEYDIDLNNIWSFSLNLEDGGSTLNTNKAFSDTMNRYQQATGSFRAYKTKPVSSLLGNISCKNMQYKDSFEKIEAWDDFCCNNELKLLVDTRGRIFIGEIDNSPTSAYGETLYREITINFNFRELTDINTVKINGVLVNGEEEI